MQRISLNVAKALKEVGYPQPQTDVWGYVNHPNNCYFTGRHSYWDEYRERRIEWDETNEFHTADDWADEIEPQFYGSAIAAPAYLEVWIWLWKEKGIHIDVDNSCYGEDAVSFEDTTQEEFRENGPEESIITAIEYLVNNNLIK